MDIPKGFRFGAASAGIKSNRSDLDVSLFTSEVPCAAAGVFTQNLVCGAPVKVSRSRVPSETVRAVIINSGNANACTGAKGVVNAREMTAQTAELIKCLPEDVLVCSTGIIGHLLPMDLIHSGIDQAAASLGPSVDHLQAAAKGMMTTDSHPKIASQTVTIDDQTVTITGVAKGAAMIGPNMATMLCVILTDAWLTSEGCDAVLREAVNQSFNCISVEGHTSTSDTVFLLANRQSGAKADGNKCFANAVTEVAQELARAIIRDGEGVEHFVTIELQGLRTREEALMLAETIANDALVKTAIAGNDPNWGRIISACGRASVFLEAEDILLKINGTLLFVEGGPAGYDEQEVSRAMSSGEVLIELFFPYGKERLTFWTTDLTQEYVRLNSEYTT